MNGTTSNNGRPAEKHGLQLGGLCLDWRAVALVVAAAVALFLWRPGLLLTAGPWLLFALCPLGMFFMMRSMGNMNDASTSAPAQDEVVQLRARIGELERARLPSAQEPTQR